MSAGLDRRLAAFRDDLADARLRGRVTAARFVEGSVMRVRAPVADLRARPSPEAGLDTQLLEGEAVRVFETREGWAWVQAERDLYVGYVAASALEVPGAAPTHRVAVPRSFTYRGADMKLPATGCHSLGARLAVTGRATTRGTHYALLESGEAMIAAHLRPVGEALDDFVAVAETLLHTPYLWGGRSGFGIDCSGLVQLCLEMTGRAAPRDTDMQEAGLGTAFDPGPDLAGLRRGDLVFWMGHVAIMTGGDTMIHANGHTMTVALERLSDAVARIAYLYGRPSSFRRLGT